MCSIGKGFFDPAQAGANLVQVPEIRSISLSSDHARSRSRKDTSVLMGSVCPRRASADAVPTETFETQGQGWGTKVQESV